MRRPASTTPAAANTAFCWPGDRSMGPGYFLRRTERSQKGCGPSDSGPVVVWSPSPEPFDGGEPPAGPDSPPPSQPLDGRIGPGSQRGRPDGPAQGPLPDWPGGRAQGPRPPDGGCDPREAPPAGAPVPAG